MIQNKVALKSFEMFVIKLDVSLSKCSTKYIQ